MPTYAAMLRGINVSGHNPIKMEQLRTLCNSLGFQNAETYVQSGNIVFQTTAENPAAVSKSISGAILESFGFDVPVIVRTSKEIRRVIANNPFLKEKDRFVQVARNFSLGNSAERLTEETRSSGDKSGSVLLGPT